MYSFKNSWPASWDDNAPITDANLIDASALWGNTLNDDQKKALRQQILDGNGWYFNLIDPGEKIVSTPLLYNKILFFTTLVPTSTTVTEDDPCYIGTGPFEAFLYAVDYKTGDFTDVPGMTYPDPNVPRVKIANPVAPKLVVTKQGDFIPIQPPIKIEGKPMDRYFWQKR
jgi:Tfp pilus tip-associated adhesin PilY1